jgi:hypothetical protein
MRGRKKLYQDYNFVDLIDENFLQSTGYLSDACRRIYFYYSDKTSLKPKEYDVFFNLFMSSVKKYDKDNEINFYYFIKRKIEEYYKLINKKVYFSDEQETAFNEFLTSTNTKRREMLYTKFLLHPIEKMVESQIHRYKLRSIEMTYKDLHKSTISFLHEKLINFDSSLGNKAYSYLGTITKNHLRNLIKKERTRNFNTVSYLDFSQGDDTNESPHMENKNVIYHEKIYDDNINHDFFAMIPQILEDYINHDDKKKFLDSNDIIVGQTIIFLLKNWETVFDSETEMTNKFKKNTVFTILRKLTGLETKYISNSLKTFRAIYDIEKKKIVNEMYNPFDDFN